MGQFLCVVDLHCTRLRLLMTWLQRLPLSRAAAFEPKHVPCPRGCTRPLRRAAYPRPCASSAGSCRSQASRSMAGTENRKKPLHLHHAAAPQTKHQLRKNLRGVNQKAHSFCFIHTPSSRRQAIRVPAARPFHDPWSRKFSATEAFRLEGLP